MRNKIIVLLLALFLGTAVTIENSDKAKETLAGFTNMRGFSTLETSSLPLNGGTLTGALFGTSSSMSGNFEASGYASASKGFFTVNTLIGDRTASSSGIYSLELGPGGTATASMLFDGRGCIQMLNTVGVPVYLRVVGTTLTVNQIKCHP